MGEVKETAPVKLFTGLLAAPQVVLPKVYGMLEAKFGAIDFFSPVIDFNFTGYYEPEMGPGLKRQYLGFKNLIYPGKLPEIKLLTNELEKIADKEGRRTINLDPGYLALPRVVLASTKDYSHRLYLGKGIYGEITLLYRLKKFEPLPWTYPDYRSDFAQGFFLELRNKYISQLKNHVTNTSD